MTEAEQARIRAARAAYQRDWRKRNPEKHKAYVNNYWMKKAKEMEAQEQCQEQKPSTDGR